MNFGKMDKRITVEERAETRSASGEAIESWSKVGYVWAQYIPVRGGEDASNATSDYTIYARFRVHYKPAWNVKTLRVTYNDRVWNITDIVTVEPRRATDLMANTEVVT